MKKDDMIAYAEVDEILNLLENAYKEKIPEKIINFFKEERDKEYKVEIDVNRPLTEQNLKRDTFVLLAILNLNYWCETEEEKQEFLNELEQNEKEKKELEERYNPDNLFKNKQKAEGLQMVEYKKPNFIQRLLDKIVKLFKK